MTKNTLPCGGYTQSGYFSVIAREPALYVETSQNPDEARRLLAALKGIHTLPCTLNELPILPMGGADILVTFPSVGQRPSLPLILAERPQQERSLLIVLLPERSIEEQAAWMEAGAFACLTYDSAAKLIPAHLSVISRENMIFGHRIAQCLRLDHLAILGKSTAGLIHNLNNPMQVVMGMSEIQLMDHPDDRSAQSIHQAAKKVHSLLTENSDRELNRLQESQAKVNVNELLNTVVNRLKSFPFFKHNIQLTITLQDLPWLNCPYEPLLLTFNHLVRNAADALLSSTKRELTIETKTTPDNEIVVRIADSGCGISQDLLPRIFIPFVSSDAFKKKECIGLGAGLGLPFVKGILHDLGGTIHVESSQEDERTIVTVTIPVR